MTDSAQVHQLRGDTDAALQDANVAVASAYDEQTLRQVRSGRLAVCPMHGGRARRG